MVLQVVLIFQWVLVVQVLEAVDAHIILVVTEFVVVMAVD